MIIVVPIIITSILSGQQAVRNSRFSHLHGRRGIGVGIQVFHKPELQEQFITVEPRGSSNVFQGSRQNLGTEGSLCDGKEERNQKSFPP